MARKKKARTRNPSPKSKPASARAKSTTKSSKAAKQPARRKPAARKGGARSTEVERRWADYLKQRTALEQAVDAVRSAEEELSSARQIEAARRKEFNECKRSLEQLLEVDTASRSQPGRKPIDLPAPSRAPAPRAEQQTTLG